MSLKSPNLDDRNFDQLVEEALRYVKENSPLWTDFSPNDPGVVLLELFAALTETMIYRLNRVPEKAYIEFLRLLGVTLNPPVAAVANLEFTLNSPQKKPLQIPSGTKVTLDRSNSRNKPPIFTTLQTVSIPAGETQIKTQGFNCSLSEAEVVGLGTGFPGLSVKVKHKPIVASIGSDLKPIVGIEEKPDQSADREKFIKHKNKAFRVWEEVENFSNLGEREFVYILDHVSGVITFAPSVDLDKTRSKALAAIPSEGSEIRIWYGYGGGIEGNVVANSLTVLKTPIAGVSVINPETAIGGREVETLENALLRGPQDLHSLQRAVTARDFELLALQSSGAVSRAKAITKSMFWKHAPAGTIQVSLVPTLSPNKTVTTEALEAQESSEAKRIIKQELNKRRLLGTTCLVNWVKYKKVKVTADAYVYKGIDTSSIESRILKRLHESINPLPGEENPNGWKFGEPLRVSHIYDIMLKEPDLSYVENVQLHIDSVPDTDTDSIVIDHFQPNTWYSTNSSRLFRTLNNGEGWELISDFSNESIQLIITNKIKAGYLAVVTSEEGIKGSKLYVSADCGSTWQNLAQTVFTINDISWTMRDNSPVLILATDDGLYELTLKANASPVQILVDPNKPTLGFYSVSSSIGIRGTFYVAIVARNLGGVFLSSQGGKSNSFNNIGLEGEDIRVLETQQDSVRTFLWAGTRAAGNEAGKGCFRWELQGASIPQSPINFQKGWQGGSCHCITFKDSLAFAGTHDKGVLWMDISKGEKATWNTPLLECGLPIRDAQRNFFPINAMASQSAQKHLLVGTVKGVYRSNDNGTNYEFISEKVFKNKVTIPETWLFCSGEHEIQVIVDDE